MKKQLRSRALAVGFWTASAAALVSAALACAGGSPPPTMQGRAGMLSQTAIAQKCADVATHDDRPFIVEWDATDLASFEAKARKDTVFVHYEGCKLDVVYECNDPAVPGMLGTYGQPTFTSGGVEGFDIANSGDLYAKLPLGAASFGGRVEAGEKLHLKYYVSGVANDTRDALYRGDLAKYAGACANVTHFVWAYNLGAFELESNESSSLEAGAGFGGMGAGADRSHSQQQLGHGGDLSSCTTQDQRGCRVPIRLALRAIKDGNNPLGAMPPTAAGVTPAATALQPGMDWKSTPSGQANEAIQEARAKFTAGDGAGCITLLQRAAGLDPRQAEGPSFNRTLADCQMKSGKCEEGKKTYREIIASQDTNHTRSDKDLDRETSSVANRTCPSSTAKTTVELVTRAANEMTAAYLAKDSDTCLARFETIAAKMDELDEARKNHDADALEANSRGDHAMESGATCIAWGKGCAVGLTYYKRWYKMRLKNMTGVDKIAEDVWNRSITSGRLTCKQ
jgi:hypothetical protein